MDDKMSKFTEIMGKSPETKVLEYFLLWGGNVDVTITDIVRASKVGKARAYGILEKFQRRGIIMKTREIGICKLYKLNDKSKIVIKSKELLKTILKESARKDLGK